MDNTQQLLQISATLYEELSMIPKGENRENFIQEINQKLDQRGKIIDALRQEGFTFDSQNKIHATLLELDKGIRERLNLVMEVVKHDMRDLQNAKKNEKQYANPYASVQVMDGMYYDKKK